MIGRKTQLIAERRNQGLSRKKMAKRIGIADETLRRAEEGLSVHVSTMRKIVEFYGLQEVTDVWPVEEVSS